MNQSCLDNLKPGERVVFKNTHGTLITLIFSGINKDGTYYGVVIDPAYGRHWFTYDEVVSITKVIQ